MTPGGLRGRGRGDGAAQHDLPAEAVGPPHPPGEHRQPGFVPCRNGQFTDNLIAFRSDEMAVPVNVGPGTAPETFTLARNAWYCLDAPRAEPTEAADRRGRRGVRRRSRFRDAEGGDLRTRPDGPALQAGVRAEGRHPDGRVGMSLGSRFGRYAINWGNASNASTCSPEPRPLTVILVLALRA